VQANSLLDQSFVLRKTGFPVFSKLSAFLLSEISDKEYITVSEMLETSYSFI
jgi:hypothetical protein